MLNFGFPQTTVGGKVVASDTNVHLLSDHTSAGSSAGEELIAPIRIQVPSGITATITILRQKSDGSMPTIGDTDHYLAVMSGDSFQIFDAVSRTDKIYYHFNTTTSSPYFVWSAGY